MSSMCLSHVQQAQSMLLSIICPGVTLQHLDGMMHISLLHVQCIGVSLRKQCQAITQPAHEGLSRASMKQPLRGGLQGCREQPRHA